MFLEVLGQLGGNMGLLLSAGFVVGLLHAFEPDHVTAMLTQVRGGGGGGPASARLRLATVRNSLLGALWGFGHTSMILLVSILVFVLALGIPSAVFDGFELAVGAVLVALGVSMYWRRGVLRLGHSHPHAHEDGLVHTHPHGHDRSHMHTHRSYLIGCLHGLAGSGGLVAINAAALNDFSGVLTFAMVFGAGSIIGMALVSGTLSVPFLLSDRLPRLKRCLQVLAGTVTVAIGLEIIHGLAVSGRLPVF